MKLTLLLAMMMFLAVVSYSQGFEIVTPQESYKGLIGETIKAPIKFKNTSDKPIVLIIRKLDAQIGTSQRNFFCLDNNCLDQKIEDYMLKIEPGQTLSSFQIALESGLSAGESAIRYVVFNKSLPNQPIEFGVNFTVEERPEKQSIYNSRHIIIQDVYPNPVTGNSFTLQYKILDDRANARVIIHNLLGNIVDEFNLETGETLMRVRTDDLSAGIYFYTLYLDNESVMTRKLLVRKD
ncbi:MAG TPA: T9SS type A sorting domain-containing protein [Ohtaekwangia sp.]